MANERADTRLVDSGPLSNCPFCKQTFPKPEAARRHAISCSRKPSGPKQQQQQQQQSCEKGGAQQQSQQRGSTVDHTADRVDPDRGLSLFFLLSLTDSVVNAKELIAAEPTDPNRRSVQVPSALLELPLSSDFSSSATDLWAALEGPASWSPFQMPDLVDPESPLQSFPDSLCSALEYRLNEIVLQLQFYSTIADSQQSQSQQAQQAQQTQLNPESIFTIANFSAFFSSYFHHFHRHLPVVHRPTCLPENVSPQLLLAVFLAGAIYTPSHEHSLAAAPRFLPAAEEYIFSHPIFELPPGAADSFPDYIEILQAALIVECTQFGMNDMQTIRRIRTRRHPSLVSALRSFGIFNCRHSVDRDWKSFVRTEIQLRLASWTFLMDCYLTVVFKNPPQITVSEMVGGFQSSDDLFEADDESQFANLAKKYQQDLSSSLSLKTFVTQIMGDPATDIAIQDLRPFQLLVIISALHSIAFVARASCLSTVISPTLLRASSRWKQLWSTVSAQAGDNLQYQGCSRHALELWWLLRCILEVGVVSDLKIAYLNNAATDDAGEIHEFMKVISRRIRRQTELESRGKIEAGIPSRRDDISPGESIGRKVVTAKDNPSLNPRNWSLLCRSKNIAILVFLVFTQGWAGAAESLVQAQANREFGVSNVAGNLSTAMYLFGIASGSLFAGPISESVGRNPTYLCATFIYLLFVLGSGLTPTFAGQIACRYFVGLFSSTTLAINGSSVGDQFRPVKRTFVFPVLAWANVAGPVIAPTVSGWVVANPRLHWRWTAYITLIISGTAWVTALLFLPETYLPIILEWKAKHLRAITGDGRYTSEHAEHEEIFHRLKKVLHLSAKFFATEPVLAVLGSYLVLLYSLLFTFLSGFDYIFRQTYGLSTAQTGACFASIAVGETVAMLAVPALYTWARRKTAYQHGASLLPEFRLWPAVVAGPLLPVSLFWLGWTNYRSISIWSSLFACALFGIVLISIYVSSYEYIIDSYGEHAAIALASITMARYLVAGGMVMAAHPMYEGLGVHWTMTLLGSISVGLAPMPLLFKIYGATLRRRSRYAAHLDQTVIQEDSGSVN
ncbi:hypothetical protein ASPZODRAFT_15457 [Penicilliopsis zonata CBS 506.65]|uniref:Major facilitator superfamily (MFS) profile domain-containing protein n=1 Tax=Penicilliopsis zonata CBS 506.65 TaxID=1073090 RepID=A0A1L9SLF8_9EURO|nr:hypothetical protein ASPZODRAFT_15457 [Penicilliopsis zonata CBS 506.65]OJJ48010.1 hypothetical protein ASPZODRAFT_15457 [Penicilliopsis zonata CBS 506.65]